MTLDNISKVKKVMIVREIVENKWIMHSPTFQTFSKFYKRDTVELY